ncbi:MAG TPA: sulfatase/phosphatase domain-containing protein, partial [Thermoanaerobaculia bacterium]|nr:sulfatase/phosphatase domain-containing protein [Thermoanaerobaculia bacterium]
PQDAFSAWADDEGKFGADAFRMVRTPRHKLILWKNPARKSELYDHVSDPEEKTNLLEAPEAQTVRRDLEARLDAWMKRTSDPALRWR